jgi:hypothetical protein
MTRRHSTAPGPTSPRASAKGLLTDRPPSYRLDDLNRRRARREADALVAELRALLDAYDTGCIPFEVFACSADCVGARMADLALVGVTA